MPWRVEVGWGYALLICEGAIRAGLEWRKGKLDLGSVKSVNATSSYFFRGVGIVNERQPCCGIGKDSLLHLLGTP